jgi:hypothetical protein
MIVELIFVKAKNCFITIGHGGQKYIIIIGENQQEEMPL